MTNQSSRPARLADRLLSWFGAPDYIIGDFVEEFEQVLRENGRFQASVWQWQQLIHSAPALCQRRWQTIMKTLPKRDKQALIFSMLLLIPAMLIVIPGLLFSLLGLAGPMNAVFGALESSRWVAWLIHPVTIIGGAVVALLLTAWPMIGFEVKNQQDQLVGSLTIRKGYGLHMVVLGTAVLFILLIFAYLLAENFHIFQSIN